jgi:formamidopyrimidine-DNA glycosylase
VPELPDLLYILARLRERLAGATVTAERVKEPIVLRFAVRGNLSLLLGRRLEELTRRSHFLCFRFEDLELAVNPMLAGRFRLAAPGEADEASLAFALGFGEQELRYLDDKKMGKACLIASGDYRAIPGMQTGGVDVLSPEFTRERFLSLLRQRRDQVRVFLLDKKALDSLGNAYADEVLFEAGIHPKTWCRSLARDDALRLHAAIVVRDFLKVRLKQVCPRCGAKVRRAGVKGMDAYFCPRCQPATRAGLVDWTRTGK